MLHRMERQPFVSVAELSDRWGVNRSRVLVWIDEGRIQATLVGKSYVIVNTPGLRRPRPRKPGKRTRKRQSKAD